MYIVIAGGGKVGSYLAETLLANGHDVAVIEENPETAVHLSENLRGSKLIIEGDGCVSRFQADAGIRRADVFVAATGQDDENLVSCEIAQRVFKVDRCVARVNSPKNETIFKKVGIETVSSTTLIAQVIQEETILRSVSAVKSLSQGNVVLKEFVVTRMRHHSNRHGVPVSDIPMPFDSKIVAISNEDDALVANDDLMVKPGDRVICVIDKDVENEVRAVFKSL